MIEAMKQALEALEASQEFCNTHTADEAPDWLAIPVNESVPKLRAVIEQMEKAEPHGYLYLNEGGYNHEEVPLFSRSKLKSSGISNLTVSWPVYANPAPLRELSDEEITKIWCEFDLRGGLPLSFAREILKAASETTPR